jgi:hypothetical protein
MADKPFVRAAGNAVFIEIPGTVIEAAIGLRDHDQAEFVAFHVGGVVEALLKQIKELERRVKELEQ